MRRRIAVTLLVCLAGAGLVVLALDRWNPALDSPDRRAGRPRTSRWGPRSGARHPAIVLVHGGGGPGFFLERPDYRPYPETLGARGFVVVMPHYAEAVQSEVQAVERTIDWLVRQPDVDSSRIGLVGFSRGGFIGSCVAGTDERIRAFVDFYGGIDADCLPEITRMPPTLVLHGARDGVVPPRNGELLAELVRRKHAAVATHIYPDQEHGFVGAALDDSVSRMVEFFEGTLRVRHHPGTRVAPTPSGGSVKVRTSPPASRPTHSVPGV